MTIYDYKTMENINLSQYFFNHVTSHFYILVSCPPPPQKPFTLPPLSCVFTSYYIFNTVADNSYRIPNCMPEIMLNILNAFIQPKIL